MARAQGKCVASGDKGSVTDVRAGVDLGFVGLETWAMNTKKKNTKFITFTNFKRTNEHVI